MKRFLWYVRLCNILERSSRLCLLGTTTSLPSLLINPQSRFEFLHTSHWDESTHEFDFSAGLALLNSFNRVGLDHVVLVKVASTAVVSKLLSVHFYDMPTLSCQG